MADNKAKELVKMTKHELSQHVRRLAKDSSKIIFGPHTKWERMPQRSIGFDDVLKVLRYGTMNREPEPGRDYPIELKCRFEKRDADKRLIGVEVAVSEDNPYLVVVTVVRITY